MSNYPDKGTPEWHKQKLDKLLKWLSLNPAKNPIVDEEVIALEWALERIEVADQLEAQNNAQAESKKEA